MAKDIFRKTFIAVLFPTLFIFALSSCGGSEKTEAESALGEGTSQVKTFEKDTTVESIFYSIPSPIETASLIRKAGVPYNKDYLNDIQKCSNYTTTGSKALNLGVYGSDLSFTSIYDQTQESMLYLKCANNLANGLGINGAFDENTANRLDANKNNRDSLLGIISESFWIADSYLKDNERPGTSSLIIAGGWIEAVYIATKLAESSKSLDIIDRIAEQKFTLDNLVGMLKKYDFDETVAVIHKDLLDLKLEYDQLKTVKVSSDSSTNSKTGVTTVGGGSKLTCTPEQLKKISEKVGVIRNNITK